MSSRIFIFLLLLKHVDDADDKKMKELKTEIETKIYFIDDEILCVIQE